MRDGLYKVEFHTVHGAGNGVVYASSGKLRGGNSIFAYIGSYSLTPEGIVAKIRHDHDPALKSIFGMDMVTLTLKGRENGDMLDFEGAALQLPGVVFKAVLMRISD